MVTIESLITKHTNKTALPKQSSYIKEWAQWYKGDVKNFHYYRLYNGQAFLNINIMSMQMAKYISETWADLLLNEKCNIVIPEANQEKFDEILETNNFWYVANNGLEKAFALGIGALVVTINDLLIGDKGSINKDRASLSIDFIDAFKVRPITVKNGKITECAFEYDNSDSKVFILHLIENGKYVIHNYKCHKGNEKVEYYNFNTGSSQPFYQIMMPNIANNLNDELTNCELGISVFANVIDGLKDLDMKYDSYYNEGILKRARTYITGDAYRVDMESGQKVKNWNPLDTQYYFAGEGEDGKSKIDTQSPTLQYTEQIAGINAQLNYVGMRCGFGQNYFKYDGTGIMTATQVISENSALFRRIVKHELLLKNMLQNLSQVIIYASNEFTNEGIGKVNNKDIAIQFDDSIIEDKGAEQERDKADVAAGLMSREEYRIKWYGEDDKTAKDNVREYFLYELINNYLPALTQGAMTPTQFVEKVYGEVENKQEIIDYITKAIQEGLMSDFGGYEE